jgi:hypothetical protein
MEVDGAILVGRALVVHLFRGPVVSGHRAHREIDGDAVETPSGAIAHRVVADIGGEVPVRDRVGRRTIASHGADLVA